MRLLLAIIMLFTFAAQAAEPDVCRPYASKTTEILIKYAWLRAYTACLNEDEAPPLPQDHYNAFCIVLPDCQFAPYSYVPPDPEPPKVYRKHRRRHK